MPRRLGQHFLKSQSVERMLRLIAPQAEDVFVEIGPGQGALTLPLAGRVRALTCIELDERLAAQLRTRVGASVTVVQGDALAVDLRTLIAPGTRLVGNLPYAISSPLLRSFLPHMGSVRDMHFMLQREVALRITASPGSKDYGILSILYGAVADVSLLARFGAACFTPPPKVDSMLIRITPNHKPLIELDRLGALFDLLRVSFTHRRKTLENNLADSYPNLKQHLRLLNIEGSKRPEALSVADYARLLDTLSVNDARA
ncbi:MAG: 16S rRNA (adenine(1518)-N(6)/adenine(1519)-N(6))-dimethyltransferase RsmA [Vicinamibacteria bacterium]|nr:16S rRNA (adenine(1518)-N(6)/adenine(1519)-N(6))-dimethyltransferase RsmA [Vicinamibacteria bacterium]